jgi:hypothetical protein
MISMSRLLVTSGILLSSAAIGWAQIDNNSPAKAEEDAYRMAITQVQRGYTMYPATSGLAQTTERIRFLLPIEKGTDYVFLVGVDDNVRDVDLYVFDEDGGQILTDRRSDRRAGTRFRASYTGTAEVYVHMVRANGLASWAVLVGTRGGAGTPRINPTGDDKSGAPGGGGDPTKANPVEGA